MQLVPRSVFPEEQKISAVQVHTPLDEPSAAQLPLDEKYEVEDIIQKEHSRLARTQQPKPTHRDFENY